jgi:acyl-coenzyme A synthetase/AMP-(fatty) acid ligase
MASDDHAENSGRPAELSSLSHEDLQTVPRWWAKAAQAHGRRELIRHEGRRATFEEIDLRSARLARALIAEGVGKGSRIGILLPNGADWIVSFLAITRVGGIAVALSTFFSAGELRYAIWHSDIAFLLAADRYLRNDYLERIAQALPGLEGSDGTSPLALCSCPHLRGIWLFGDRAAPKWARGHAAELEDRGAESSVCSQALLAALEAVVSPADDAVIIYTSGSTAEPKGVVHLQGTLIDKVLFMVNARWATPWDLTPDDRSIVTGPFFWIGGFLVLAGAVTVGATVVCVDEHSPEALFDAIRREDATQVGGQVSALRSIAHCAHNVGELTQLKPQNPVQRPFFNNDPSIASDRFCNSLGMTETFGPHSGQLSPELLPERLAGSFGVALGGMELKIADPVTGVELGAGREGELLVRGPWLMDGFYKRERRKVFLADGYYATGDKALIDDEGNLFYRGRLSGMIKTSGANVSPEEVEVVLLMHPAVAEVAVVGMPDETAGEIVVAAVVLRHSHSISEFALRSALKGQISSFKIPRRILFMAAVDLPRTPSSKIRKPQLIQMLRGMLVDRAR